MPRKAGLDRDMLVGAAVRLVNAEGTDALTLGRLAKEMGVQPPSLYNHVDGLPGLRRELALLNARLLGERLANAAIGKSGPAAVMALANAYRAYIKENPGLYGASLRASGTSQPVDDQLADAENRVVEIGLLVLANFDLAGEDALHAVRGLRSLVHGFATLEISGGFGLPLDCDESFQRLLQMFIHGLGIK